MSGQAKHPLMKLSGRPGIWFSSCGLPTARKTAPNSPSGWLGPLSKPRELGPSGSLGRRGGDPKRPPHGRRFVSGRGHDGIVSHLSSCRTAHGSVHGRRVWPEG